MSETIIPTRDTSRKRRDASSGGGKGEIWWSNGIFFVSIHIFAMIGAIYLSPLTAIDPRTAVLCFISWQLASFGITIGYHRLWSHRAFTATAPLRIALAWMGSMGFQGSIKWWVLRHRLHHRFTDSNLHDPYSASKGLWFSHCGWIFRKPSYPRMKLIERGDLDADPVVRFQHKHYVPIALFSGLILPSLIAHWGWNDWLGGLVWGGAIARLLIWHTTFCINSLAHWTGLQPYTEEVTARGNYLLAVLTSGEGNHNFHHAFPKDFRNGPHPADWDPSKWFIWVLHKYTSLVPTIARTPESAVRKARARVFMAQADRLTEALPPHEMVRPKEYLPVWSRAEVRKRHGEYVKEEHGVRRRVLVLLEGCVVDVGGYLEDHPGGNDLLLSHCVLPLPSESTDDLDIDSGYASSELASPPLNKISLSSPEIDEVDQIVLKDATRAFFGGMNNHSGAAKEWMRCLRVARLEK
ncbi:hypothetical protein I203_100433 [Kwoniella mangroviensis CBS 8507]|uniref:uncharacterized protein n=1 Tax=Kwoniella mangroviensis CBS 8507 TaxID=1296122 RepID=UPI00080D7247|nr:uncharacterized protein I203_05697 [Kwoniella mangroviensis CBS 8507]OCF64955.1 hypothetical protein I203_05697 [Kwoniella mangroviensis CBS 8507]